MVFCICATSILIMMCVLLRSSMAIMRPSTAVISVAVMLASTIAPSGHAACGVAGCTINTNWETQGPHLGPGLRMDLRVEYIDQDVLRKGANKAQHEEVVADPLARHDERETLNRNLRAHLDYTFDANWGVSLDVPIVSRKHTHVALEDGATERWDFTALGDARVLGRYALAGDANRSCGFTFGAKLPTGKFDETNHQGESAERSLQPGSGTTDAVLGAFYQRGNAASPWSWFGQLSLQQALNGRDGYKPGQQVNIDAGTSYKLSPGFAAMLQLNLQHRARDNGLNAEPDESGGEFAFLSPGVQLRIGASTQAYAFIQLPVYRHVNGTQLTADQALLFGLSHRF
jgi:hypothetical protein